VDDNTELVRAFGGLLQGDDLTVVGGATTAAEGLRRIEELRPDVVLLDVGVAEDSAVDVARHLGDRSAPDVPRVIFMSAYNEDDFGEFVRDSPAVGFIAKSDLSAAAIMQLLGEDAAGP
jgi:CheY-like chemotaxis protein